MVDCVGLTQASEPPGFPMSRADLDELYAKPGHLIRRCQQIAVGLFIDEAAGLGCDVTPVQYAAMTAVAANPDIDATRLSDLIAFDRSTLGNVIERLEAKGWIERRPGNEDRRTKRLRLTDAGTDLDDTTPVAAPKPPAPNGNGAPAPAAPAFSSGMPGESPTFGR